MPKLRPKYNLLYITHPLGLRLNTACRLAGVKRMHALESLITRYIESLKLNPQTLAKSNLRAYRFRFSTLEATQAFRNLAKMQTMPKRKISSYPKA
jgi:hypothetical protein